jgi:hypothetical protein
LVYVTNHVTNFFPKDMASTSSSAQ